jgi:hypothetical protein
MIPNFEPDTILPRLASLIDRNDLLLFSANLAPGPDYSIGVKRILPLYDNDLTRDWLMTLLLDLGIEREDGVLRFIVEERAGLKCVAAYFHFRRPCQISIDSERIEFASGESIRLFFSYRYTPELVRQHLGRHQLQVETQWVTKSEEEAVFLVKRSR